MKTREGFLNPRMSFFTAICAAVFACTASARTMTMTVNKAGDDVSSFDFAFDNVGADTTNSLWMVYGLSDGGDTSFSSWPNVRHVADIPGDVTALTGVQLPPKWGVAVTHLRFFLSQAGRLPGADRLEYIQSSGNQYIATSFHPNGDSVVETEIAFTSNPSGSNQNIFCARSNYQATTFTLFWLGSYWRLDYNNAIWPSAAQSGVASPGTDRHALYVDSGGVTVDGTLQAYTTPSAASSFTAGGPMSLFASRIGSGSDWGNQARMRLYSFRAWNTHADEAAFGNWANGTSTAAAIPALDLVPCRKNGAVGLYDRPSGEFLTSAGGAFSAGNDVAAAVNAPDVATELVSAGSADMAYWTGNGGADTRISTPANWGAADNETLPDLDSGTTDAMFAIGGSALVDRSAAFNGISFASSSDFSFEESDGALTVGEGGISTDVGTKPTVKHTFNVPMELTSAQTWFANTNATIEFTKPLYFFRDNDTLTLSGAGAWNFRATNTFPNDIVATGDGVTDFGAARVRVYADNALGGPGGTFFMNVRHGALEFHGVTNSRPIVTYCTKSDHDAGLYVTGDAGATNVFDATFNHTNANLRLYIGRGTTFIANEKFKTSSACYVWLTGSGSAEAHWIVNKPLSIHDRFTLPAGVVLDLNAPTNRISFNKGSIAGRINLNVPYAVSYENGTAGQATQFVPNYGTLDLRGNDNALGIIYTYRTNDFGTITSEMPATMHLVDNYLMADYDSGQFDENNNKIRAFGYTNRVEFTGCASFSKEGKYTNRLMRVSSTYGDLTVTKGRLEMDPGATWANASNLVVKGTGLFTLENHPAEAPAFGAQLVVHVEPGYEGNGQDSKARIELLNDTPQVCANLYVDGKRQHSGFWGSAEAAAANPDLRVQTAPFFSGTGLLQIPAIPFHITVR